MNRQHRLRLLLPLLLLTGPVSPLPAQEAPAAKTTSVRIRHNGQALGTTPLVTPAPADLPLGAYILKTKNAEPTSALVFDLAGKRHLGLVLASVPAGLDLTATLTPSEPPASGVALASSPSSNPPDIAINLDGQPFTNLVLTEPTKPYLYPVVGPTGAPFTRAFPMQKVDGEDTDHNHQRSFWFTHGEVNGYDFWASDPRNPPNPRFGSIKPRDLQVVGSTTPAPVLIIQHDSDWLGPDGKRVCADKRTLTFYASSSPRLIDVEITLAATDGPVTFGDTKEGSFGLRVPSSIDVKRKQGGKITNAEGITDNDAWGKRSPWVDYSGPIAGQTAGIAILNHPDSFRFPTAWHVRDYGLFAANPFGNHDFGIKEQGEHTLQPGETLHLRYRVILHEGDTRDADIPDAFAAFSQPPTLEFIEK